MTLLLLSLLTAHAAGIRASSQARDDAGTHVASHAVDGLFDTGWAEAGDSPTGQWIELDLGRPTRITNLTVWPGNLKKGAQSYREYSRPRTLAITVDGQDKGISPVILEDKMQRAEIALDVTGRRVRLTIQDAYEGIVFTDTHIAEIAVNFPGGDLRRMDSWLASADGQRQDARFIEQLEANYVRVKSAEFGDKDAFKFLADAVANGAPHVRARLSSLVPAGYRAQAVPVHAKAHKALRNLKDANAIPAFELAALRATGREEVVIKEVVGLLRAYQEMIGTANMNVMAWGETGWALGALRSFGEPLAMDMDRQGRIYVADTGNNRVQRFDLDGRGDRQWGPAPDLASAWFRKSRDWYVSGAKPGDAVGAFSNPLDITVIPSKEGEGFAALDAEGRVQIFDHAGRPTLSWNLTTTNVPQPKLGGEGYLVYIPNKKVLVAILQNDAAVHSLDGGEISRWRIKDGTPRAVEVSAQGQLLFGYGNQVIQYNPDGFRYGTVITNEHLGSGHEEFDIAMDEKKKLWALTDAGNIVKFKRPGVVDFSVRAVDRPLKHPRIAVREGIVFFLSDDRIELVDALQAKMDADNPPEDPYALPSEDSGKKKKRGR
jgi:hypothetical protein